MLAVENEGAFSREEKNLFIPVKPPILKGEPDPSYPSTHPTIHPFVVF